MSTRQNTLVSTFTSLLVLPICLAADAPKNKPQPAAETSTIEGMGLKVPIQPAPGKPWLWVGEFAGHLGSFEDGLVAKGWHVAWVNVSNQFGSPRAMDVWEKVYAELQERRRPSSPRVARFRSADRPSLQRGGSKAGKIED